MHPNCNTDYNFRRKVVKIGKVFKKKKSAIPCYALTKVIIKSNIKHRPPFVLLGIFLTGRGRGMHHLSIELDLDMV